MRRKENLLRGVEKVTLGEKTFGVLPESLLAKERQPSKNSRREWNSGNQNMGRNIGIVPAISWSVETTRVKFRNRLHFYFFVS